MRLATILGVLLIVFGIFALVSEGITYTKNEKIFQIGSVEATAKHQKTVPIPPLVGVACLAGGVFLVIKGARE
jgi:hypothetical protein